MSLVTDGRGTPGRGPQWSKAVSGNTLFAPLGDQVDALEAICAQSPTWTGGVGIRGWSYGGALAAIAVIRRPDVFHAAVSGGRAARSAALRHAQAGAIPRPAKAEPGRIRPVLHHHRGRQPDQAAAADSWDG